MKSLNLYNKLFSLIVMLIAIILADQFYIVFTLIIISLVMSILLKDYDGLQLVIISIIVSLFYYIHPFLLIFVKVVLVGIFFILTRSMISKKEKRFLLEKITYLVKGNKTFRFYLDHCYKKDLFNQNLCVYDNLDKYQRRKNSKYMISEVAKKTNLDMQDYATLNKIRFFGMFNKKTSMIKHSWNKDDNTLCLLSLLVFILVIIYR